MKSLQLLLALLFINLTAIYAQHSISGNITDKQNQTLPFANVILINKNSPNTPTGVISDENGNYRFENVKEGTYTVKVSLLGFKDKATEEFQLTSNKTFDFQLTEENESLDEVVVTSKRPVIKKTAEKLIVDLEKSEMTNTNLQDVMRKVPGVLVTNNGISVAGNSGVRILINGKTTEYMDVDTLLRDFPADNIAKVEVVEQPGAEYDASGSGAIINIILKKNISIGTHGSAMVWMGEDEGFEYGTRASIASYKNKLNWQTSLSYSEPTWRDDLFLVRTVEDEIYDQATISPFKPINLNLSGNIDYYLNDKHAIGVGGRWRKRISERISTSDTFIEDDTDTSVLFSESSFDIDRITFNINPYYEYKSESEKLIVDFNYVDYDYDNLNDLYDVAGSTVAFTDRRYLQNGEYNIKTYKLDYSKEFSDNFKLSVGSKYAMVDTNNNLESYLEDNGDFVLSEENSSQFFIEESIFAAYSKVNIKAGKWDFSGGLRYEDSDTEGTSIFMNNGTTTTVSQTRPISKLFPSASISREINEKLGASVAYSYRIRRPSYNSLNSFETFLDPFSAEQGNPNLRPAFTNSYQFNLTFEGQPFFTIGYRETTDAISDLITQNNADAQIRQSEVNLAYKNANWNFRLIGPLSFIKGLDGYTGFIVTNNEFRHYYGITDTTGNTQRVDLDLNQWNLFWFIQASYKLPWDVNFELSGNYGTGALEDQIEVDWLAGLDFSFGKKFLDDKLKVNLGFNKMLNRGFNGTIDYGNGNAQVESNGSRQNVQLRVSYSFGSKFGKKKSKRNSSRDEENRIDDGN